VLRHAEARSVVVSARFANACYQISIEDDGLGKPGATGRGMRNMLDVKSRLGGRIEWIWGERGTGRRRFLLVRCERGCTGLVRQ